MLCAEIKTLLPYIFLKGLAVLRHVLFQCKESFEYRKIPAEEAHYKFKPYYTATELNILQDI